MKFYRVRNWDKYQHYKDRNPPWIKVHHALFDDYQYACLPDAGKLLLFASFLLAACTGNKIPADPRWVQQRAGLSCKPNFEPLITAGFIEELSDGAERKQDASNTLAFARSREERREETEERREEGAREALAPDGLDQQAWDRWRSYRAQTGKPIKPASAEAAMRSLAKFGADQAAVVEQSVANGWQGIFALKTANGSGKPRDDRDAEHVRRAERLGREVGLQ